MLCGERGGEGEREGGREREGEREREFVNHYCAVTVISIPIEKILRLIQDTVWHFQTST